jgi:hypothetical protein
LDNLGGLGDFGGFEVEGRRELADGREGLIAHDGTGACRAEVEHLLALAVNLAARANVDRHGDDDSNPVSLARVNARDGNSLTK